MKVLLNFLLLIPLDEKRGGNKVALSKKTFSKTVLLIYPLHDFSDDALLLLPLHSLIVSSSLHLLGVKLDIGVFGKDNARKGKRDNPGSIGVDANRRIGADNPGTRTNTDIEADNLVIVADNLGIVVDNPDKATDNLGIAADDLSTIADDPGTATNDPGARTDVDTGINNLGIVASNKTCGVSLFALRHIFFLLAPFSKLVTAFLQSSLPFLICN